MNPFWLVRNVRRALRVCPTWRGRLQLLRFLYAKKLPAGIKFGKDEAILFQYPPSVGQIRALLRNASDGFIFGEVFDHLYYDFDLPVAPKTILDLGANVGYTVMFFAHKYPHAQIACVEPMPQNIAVLRQNLLLNEIRATVFEAAVAVEDGQMQMETDVHDYGHKVVLNKSRPTGALVSCKGLSVPSLMQRLGWERIDLLKIDIEGYEQVLLKENCDWLNCVDTMCIECHPGFTDADLKEMASKYGFEEPKRLPGIWLVYRGRPVPVN